MAMKLGTFIYTYSLEKTTFHLTNVYGVFNVEISVSCVDEINKKEKFFLILGTNDLLFCLQFWNNSAFFKHF